MTGCVSTDSLIIPRQKTFRKSLDREKWLSLYRSLQNKHSKKRADGTELRIRMINKRSVKDEIEENSLCTRVVKDFITALLSVIYAILIHVSVNSLINCTHSVPRVISVILTSFTLYFVNPS